MLWTLEKTYDTWFEHIPHEHQVWCFCMLLKTPRCRGRFVRFVMIWWMGQFETLNISFEPSWSFVPSFTTIGFKMEDLGILGEILTSNLKSRWGLTLNLTRLTVVPSQHGKLARLPMPTFGGYTVNCPSQLLTMAKHLCLCRLCLRPFLVSWLQSSICLFCVFPVVLEKS